MPYKEICHIKSAFLLLFWFLFCLFYLFVFQLCVIFISEFFLNLYLMFHFCFFLIVCSPYQEIISDITSQHGHKCVRHICIPYSFLWPLFSPGIDMHPYSSYFCLHFVFQIKAFTLKLRASFPCYWFRLVIHLHVFPASVFM